MVIYNLYVVRFCLKHFNVLRFVSSGIGVAFIGYFEILYFYLLVTYWMDRLVYVVRGFFFETFEHS